MILELCAGLETKTIQFYPNLIDESTTIVDIVSFCWVCHETCASKPTICPGCGGHSLPPSTGNASNQLLRSKIFMGFAFVCHVSLLELIVDSRCVCKSMQLEISGLGSRPSDQSVMENNSPDPGVPFEG